MSDGKFIGLGGVGLLTFWLCADPVALAAIGVAALYRYRRQRSASSADAAWCSTNDKTKEVN